MKPVYVSDLEADQNITSFFLVCEKEIRATREGKPYLRLELGDRTGRVEARMWDDFDSAAALERDTFVKVKARVEIFRNRPQLSIELIRSAEPQEVEAADFFPHTAEDVEQLYARLREFVAGVADPWLRRLLEAVVADPAMASKLKRAPAAKVMHHAYLGGLLEHVVSLCELCRVVAARYPEVHADLLLAGAVLHDIGKTEELSYEFSLGYTTEGLLVGHIPMGLEIVRRKIDTIPGFPSELKTLLEHMILSHHGHYEFGSPRLPQFREAVLLHYLDDLDSKMAAMRESLASGRGEGVWTDRNAALERRLLRLEEFWRAETPGAAKAQAAPVQQKLPVPEK